MPRLVIPTVGTSILTNQIDRGFENDWYFRLQETANSNSDEVKNYHPDVSEIIETLKERAEEKLNSGDIGEIREASAELNGIYGLYQNQLEQGTDDVHLLVATDTEQGRSSAELVESFLRNQGVLQTSTYIPEQLSTASSDAFLHGTAKAIPFIQETIFSFRRAYNNANNAAHVCFNLVGGFKALQGYFNTIGMFYANEIIYIFEESNEVITIPRLPITIDCSKIEPYKVQLAMMDVMEIPASWEEAKKVPKEWVLIIDRQMILSTWGQLLWNQCNEKFISGEKPLKFPKIEYNSSFINDYESKSNQERISLHNQLARAACLLNNHRDGISAMKQDGIFRLRRYVGKDIDHFDLPKDRRVSCRVVGDILQLRHSGEHNHVNNNP